MHLKSCGRPFTSLCVDQVTGMSSAPCNTGVRLLGFPNSMLCGELCAPRAARNDPAACQICNH